MNPYPVAEKGQQAGSVRGGEKSILFSDYYCWTDKPYDVLLRLQGPANALEPE